MRSFEVTKILGAILFVALVVTTIKVVTNHLYGPEAEAPAREAAAPATPGKEPAEQKTAAASPEEAAPAEAAQEAAAKPAEEAPEKEARAEEKAPAEAKHEEVPAEAGKAPSAGDAEAGEKVFKAHLCVGCHKFEPGKHGAGPSLAGVFGAKAGHAEGFSYSDALAQSGLTWDEATLDKWIQMPKALVPGTKMILGKPVTDAKDRADLIAYLKKKSAEQ